MSETTGNFDSAAAQAAGVTMDVPVFVDYWGFEETQKHFLPDGQQYVVLQRMNEGAKAKYQREIRSDVIVSRGTGDARMKADPATERHALIKTSVVGWKMMTRDHSGNIVEVPFTVSGGKLNLEKFLSVADPKIIEDIEKACRKLNPWLLQEMSVEDIDREIDNLREMREAAVKRDAGE